MIIVANLNRWTISETCGLFRIEPETLKETYRSFYPRAIHFGC
jgi:hypothetical protein